MSAAYQTDLEIDVQIQRQLITINSLVLKINVELALINEIVKSDGYLDVALTEAIRSLTSQAEAAGINLPINEEIAEDNDILPNRLEEITADFITEKLKMLS